MNRIVSWMVLLALMTACATRPTPTVSVAPTPTAVAPRAAATDTATPKASGPRVFLGTDELGYVHTYYIDPLLQNPTPKAGEYVLVRPRLFKNGNWRVGAMSILVEWRKNGELQSCQFMPFYLAGCNIKAEGFAPGVFVPLTITIAFDGQVFTDYAGFTPQ